MFKKHNGFVVLCLAGGFGTRIKHLLGDKPKPLAEINGKPFLFWLIQDLKLYGAKEILLLTHYNHEAFLNFCSDFSNSECLIRCIREDTPQGTGGAILSAIQNKAVSSQDILILNGDTFVEIDYNELFQDLKKGFDLVMTAKNVDDTSRYGSLITDKSNRLLEFKEKISGKGLINAGVMAVKTSAFSGLEVEQRPLSLEKDLIPRMLKEKKLIKVTPSYGSFLDIGTEESLARADNFLRNIFKQRNEKIY